MNMLRFIVGRTVEREARLLRQTPSGPEGSTDVPHTPDALPPLERGNIGQYVLQMLTVVSRLFNAATFRTMQNRFGSAGMQSHLDTFMESRGYGPVTMPYGPSGYPTYGGGFPRMRRPRGPRAPRSPRIREGLPTTGALHTVEIRDETPRFGVRIARGGTNTEIIINTADLSVNPPNGSDILRDNGIRVIHYPLGGRNGFRIEFTRPGDYGVGRLPTTGGGPMNWSVIALAASPVRPPVRPTITGRPPETGTLPSALPVSEATPTDATFETLPNGLRRPTFGTTSTRWRADVTALASRLEAPSAVNEKLRIRPVVRTALREYLGTQGSVTFEQNTSAPDGQEFSFRVGTERWFLTERTLIGSEMSSFNPANCILVLRKESNPLAQRPVQFRTLFPSGNRFSVTGLQTTIAEAEERRRNEESDPARVAEFDLPRDRDVGYVGICDKDSLDLLHISHFPGILNNHGYKMVTTGEWATAIDRQNPMSVILAQVSAMHTKGVRDFMLDLYPHGTSSLMEFSNGQTIRPADLRALTTRFSDSKFLIRTNSCYSGGMEDIDLRDAFSTDEDAGRRLTIVYQTTNRTPNRVSAARESRNSYISTYDALLIRYMQAHPGCRIGEAMRHADLETKRLYPGADAGVVRSGRTTPVRTVRTEPRRDPLLGGDGGTVAV